jgi:solute carrier family 41
MQEVDQLIMIIPVVLNLNGNLEMNLSARLATAANIGEFDDPIVRRSMIIGSLALLQVQTASVSFVAACIALILGRFVPRTGPSAPPPSSGPTNSTTLALRSFLTGSIESRQIAHTLPTVDQGRKSGIKTSVCFPSILPIKYSYSRLSG